MSGTTEAITQVEEVKRESYGIELSVIQDMLEPATSTVHKHVRSGAIYTSCRLTPIPASKFLGSTPL